MFMQDLTPAPGPRRPRSDPGARALFKEIEKKTGLAIYFADPYSAWQRGTNENTNGLLRRYFPKGAGFRNMTDEMLASAVRKLNHRPRKCLAYRTPHEVFQEARRGALGK